MPCGRCRSTRPPERDAGAVSPGRQRRCIRQRGKDHHAPGPAIGAAFLLEPATAKPVDDAGLRRPGTFHGRIRASPRAVRREHAGREAAALGRARVPVALPQPARPASAGGVHRLRGDGGCHQRHRHRGHRHRQRHAGLRPGAPRRRRGRAAAAIRRAPGERAARRRVRARSGGPGRAWRRRAPCRRGPGAGRRPGTGGARLLRAPGHAHGRGLPGRKAGVGSCVCRRRPVGGPERGLHGFVRAERQRDAAGLSHRALDLSRRGLRHPAPTRGADGVRARHTRLRRARRQVDRGAGAVRDLRAAVRASPWRRPSSSPWRWPWA